MLEAHDLVKRYADRTALDGFTLTIAPAEICGLIGHNGAGKTTFVEIVTGLVRADAGTVTIAGLPPERARHLTGVGPQEQALYLSASVRQNLRLFGGLAGLGGRALRTAIDETATALRLTEVLDRPVGLLSGGQRRRTQAATALLHRPRLLLLDEPTVGADPETRAALLDLIKQVAGTGTAVCYTTHYLPELVDLGASLALCAAGRVIARGRQDELLADLPGHLDVTHADGRTEHVTAADPAAELARLLADGVRPASVDIRPATLDDLYHSLAVTR
ncbi:ATP-binding cassette domain-containing protein [Hamadaea tsunoensis]|uniref:ATP-binding cassette domain-containing protein n=1 Tax=Hamadaea tsunoensis TaxID=53368 RepID=UPI0004273DC2|nr:ABC transporter ATP-binding protein [Hamadaea tsunoensis]